MSKKRIDNITSELIGLMEVTDFDNACEILSIHKMLTENEMSMVIDNLFA